MDTETPKLVRTRFGPGEPTGHSRQPLPSGSGSGNGLSASQNEELWVLEVRQLGAVVAWGDRPNFVNVEARADLWTSCFTPRELRLLCDRAGLDAVRIPQDRPLSVHPRAGVEVVVVAQKPDLEVARKGCEG